MDNYWWCAILFRLLLPLIISAAVFIRPTITSYIYLLVGCYMPFFSVPTNQSMQKSTGLYLKILIITCILTSCFVLSFYFAIYFPTEREYDLNACSPLETVLRTFGVVEFQGLDFSTAVPWCLPEPLMLSTSLILFFTFKRLSKDTGVMRATTEMENSALIKEANKRKLISMMLSAGKYLLVFLYCFTGVLRPNVFGGIYYFVFLSVLTYWACNQTLGRVFARVVALIIPIIFCQLTILFVYQLQFFQESKEFDEKSLWGRLLSLVSLKTYKSCEDPRLFQFHDHTNATYALPICVFFLYMLSVLVSREIFQIQDGVINLIVAAVTRRNLSRSEKWRKAFRTMQRQREDAKYTATEVSVMADKIKNFIEQIFEFVIGISSLAANFIMMIWAIVYIGWKTLILMIWANLIWLLPFRKKVFSITIPLVVIWVWFLLITHYIYLMPLTNEELPERWGIFHLKSGVERTSDIKWVHLLTKSLFAIVIFVPMRQLWQEKALKKQQELDLAVGITEASDFYVIKKSPVVKRMEEFCLHFFSIWWIWVVILTMIWMDFFTTSNIFRIAFVGLALFFVATFQLCPFRYWKKVLPFYWWLIIIYSMINLFWVYIYQIKETREMLFKLISQELLEKYGFEAWKDPKKITAALANPLFFQIAVVIQQNYLQKEFNRRTSPTSAEDLERENFQLAQSNPKWRKIKTTFRDAKNNFFHFLEVHLQNIVLLIGWYMCLFDMCAIFFPFLLLFTASCVFGRTFTSIITYFISFLVQILIMCRLVYMNLYQHHLDWNYVGYYTRNGKSFNKTLNSADWLGFHRSRWGREWADFGHVSWCFFYVFVVTISRIVDIRMKNYRLSRNLPTIKSRVLFPGINYLNCHQDSFSMLKFFANSGFYKFGCEICIVFTSIVMALRMDAVAILLSLWLLIMVLSNRSWLRILWLPVLVIAAIAVPLQYLSTLGFPPIYWNESGTTFWSSTDFLLRIQQFCHLMNMAHPPNGTKISLDFFMLILFSRQLRVFNHERHHKLDALWPPGSNDDVAALVDNKNVVNPVPDFVTYTRSYLDIFKRIFFTSWFYLSLSCTFLAGSLRPTLYSYGYILGAFFFAWEGTDMFLRPTKNIIQRWNMLIVYTILVMMFRTVSQIFGCILNYEKIFDFYCPIYEVFTIGCVDKFDVTEGVPNLHNKQLCSTDKATLGIGYDCVCLFFLVFQQRIYKSFHFFHIVNDAKAQIILAHRGAQFIEEERRIQRQSLDARDEQIRDNIERKIIKVRNNHQKFQGEAYQRRRKNHRHVLKSSDYYMFDDNSLLNDIPLMPKEKEEDDQVFDPYDPQPFAEYFGLLHSSNIPTVLEERAFRRRQKNALQQGKKPEEIRRFPDSSKPGTSKATRVSLPTDQSKITKIFNFLTFLWGLLESILVSITGLLNRSTKRFRNILRQMNKERKILKEKSKYSEGVRVGSNKIWRPVNSYTELLNSVKKEKDQPNVDIIQYTIYVKLLRAIWYTLIAHSEWICYCIIILNQVMRANFISLPLVILTFCWGALTVPKPTKTFWVVIIAYIFIMLFVKNFFVMNVIPWNEHEEKYSYNLFFPPVMIGIAKFTNTTFNFLLLVSFLFHRVVLQMLGLWKTYTYRSASIIPDGFYVAQYGKLLQITPEDAKRNSASLEVTSVNIQISDYFPNSLAKGIIKYAENMRSFTQQLITPSSTQIPVDVYTPMFLCDLVNMVLVMFFFGSFSADNDEDGLIEFIQDNRVPMAFIIIVIMYFLLMVVDRAIYMRKNRFAKLTFHFFSVLICHFYFFILYPMFTSKRFADRPVVQVFYVFKCLYFLFSAYQIRNGYPLLISFHHLWHGRSVFNRFGYKFYRQIPYFFEMRTLLDWICSDSSLGVNDWFKMEDVIQNIFDQMCEQEFDEKWSEPAGKARNRTKKYVFGGILYVLLILTVIFPFLLFSLGGTVGITTHPAKIKIELFMGSAEPIFESYASQFNIKTLSNADYMNLTKSFNNIQRSEEIFGSFQPEDVVVVSWSPDSLTKWSISDATYNNLLEDLRANTHFFFRLEIQYTHEGHGGNRLDRTFGQTISIPPLPNAHRKHLLEIVEFNETKVDSAAWLPLIFPKFMMITNQAKARPLAIMGEEGDQKIYAEYKEERGFADGDDEDDNDNVNLPADPKILRNLLAELRMNKKGDMWWHVTEECSSDDDNYFYYLKDLAHNSCDNIVIYLFNERVFSDTMSYITRSGILGLYLLYFMLVIGIIRSCRIQIDEIWIEDLPDSKDLLRKSFEVYIARDMQNYELEEELFAELIFIMRSREILIKMSRFKDSPYNPAIVVDKNKKK